MTLATSEVLDLAADTMERIGWGTGAPAWDPDNGRGICIEGAIAAAAGLPKIPGLGPNDRALRACPAYQAVQSFLNMSEDEVLYLYNDLIARSESEVVGVLRGAAEVERAKESRKGYDLEDQPLPLDVA